MLSKKEKCKKKNPNRVVSIHEIIGDTVKIYPLDRHQLIKDIKHPIVKSRKEYLKEIEEKVLKLEEAEQNNDFEENIQFSEEEEEEEEEEEDYSDELLGINSPKSEIK